MEKHTPHYPLDAIKAEVAVRGIRCFTFVALRGAAEMQLSDAEVLRVIAGISRTMFRKSMTTHANHQEWQDVYNAPTPKGPAYIKFTLRSNGSIVISFKPL